MGFNFKTGYIGPFAITLGRAHQGETQKFRYKVPEAGRSHIPQGTFILEGKFLANWSSGASDDQIYETGGNLADDRQFKSRPLVLNEDLTLTALTEASYVCVSAVGIEQKVYVERLKLSPGQEHVVPRYELLLVGGGDSAVHIGEHGLRRGARMVYARTSELVVRAEHETHIGVMSFRG